MKILQIFGVVAAVHAGLFLVLFAVPGCRSSGKAGAAKQPGVVEPVAVTSPGEPLTPSLVEPATPLNDAALNPAFAPASAPAVSTTPGRYAPTRPDAAAAASAAPSADVKPASTYTVVKNDSLWGIAKKHGITVAELAAANNLSSKAGVRIGQVLIVPGGSDDEPAAVASRAAPAPVAGTAYTVVPGDTLSGIAKKHGTTVVALRKANNLTGDMLHAGQSLTIPAGSSAAAPAAKTTVAAPSATASLTHTVKPGETLGAIARKYNVTVGELATANNITDPTKLRAGQALKVPGWQTPGSSPAKASVAAVAPVATPAPAPMNFVTEPVSPTSVVPEPIVPETVVPAPVAPTPSGAVVPSEAPLVPVVPVEESTTEAPRVY